MQTPKAIILILAAACAPLLAQAEPQAKLPSVAIIDPRGNPRITEMDRKTFRGTIGEFIIASKKYELVDRAQIERVLKEQKFQRDGLVNPATMKKIGNLLGADIICAIDLLREGANFSAEIMLIDVENGKMYGFVQEIAEKDDARELKKLAEKMGGRLLQVESPSEAYERERREKQQARERAEQKRIQDQKSEDERRERAEREERERAERERAERDAPKDPKRKGIFGGGKSPAAEAEERARKEAEERARKEAETKAAKDAEELRRRDAEERTRKDAEAKAVKEAEERARKEAEERTRKEAEAKAAKDAEELRRREADAKAAKDAEELRRREAEVKAAKDAEELRRREAEAKAAREAEERARKDADAKAAKDAEELRRREAEAKAAKDAEELRRREAEERARKDVEAKTAREAEERARKEAEAKAAKETEAGALEAPVSPSAIESAKATINRLMPAFTFEKRVGGVSCTYRPLAQWQAQKMQAVVSGADSRSRMLMDEFNFRISSGVHGGAGYWHSLHVEIVKGELRATSRYVYSNKKHMLFHTNLTAKIGDMGMTAQAALVVGHLSSAGPGITTEEARITDPAILRFIADNPGKKVDVRLEGGGGTYRDYVLSEVAHTAIIRTLELYDAMETLKKAGVPLEKSYDQ
jgi:hypothetical protein